eukprot:TRINITY_DN1373_c0_g1_i1.p1 TRINITY_DN1373_c0_g1~~TRINITY_DN1373_c0_g1_i1.p1  ORF type:complete len:106 (+),score=31.54 TRINITY_DN1373_c0_g1_i1:83-400(+)
MKTVLAFCCLVAAAAAVPQPQSFRERIRDKILNSENNPCGAGVKPSSCTCPDGTTFTPGSGQQAGRQPCGAGVNPTCTCPDGTTFTPNKDRIREKVQAALAAQQG